MQSQYLNGTSTAYLVTVSNYMLDLSEVDVLRYAVYSLYLWGDAILATKTAIVAFFGQFLLVILKISYKEPRPFWTHPDIKGLRCQTDFEGPSDHMFIVVFLGTYLNIIYLHMYAKKPKKVLSALCLLLLVAAVVATAFSGLLLGHTYLLQSLIGLVYALFFTLGCLSLDT
jgi:membrane-associated phospholipid phosphatase